jgi:hypothetical protein
MAVTPLRPPLPPTPDVMTGVVLDVVVPFPSTPYELYPHAATVPLERSARLWA